MELGFKKKTDSPYTHLPSLIRTNPSPEGIAEISCDRADGSHPSPTCSLQFLLKLAILVHFSIHFVSLRCWTWYFYHFPTCLIFQSNFNFSFFLLKEKGGHCSKNIIFLSNIILEYLSSEFSSCCSSTGCCAVLFPWVFQCYVCCDLDDLLLYVLSPPNIFNSSSLPFFFFLLLHPEISIQFLFRARFMFYCKYPENKKSLYERKSVMQHCR